MNKIIKIVVLIIDFIFGWGIGLSLFAGGITVLGFIIALILGGETAGLICTFIYKTVFVWIISASSLLVLLGLIRIYLTKEHSFKM